MGPCFSTKYKGEGRSLGSGNGNSNAAKQNLTAEERRKRQGEAAERRAQAALGGARNKSTNRPKPKPKPTTNTTKPVSAANPKQSSITQQPIAKKPSQSGAPTERSQKLAEAAERRAQEQYRGLSQEKQEELKLKAEKDRLLGQIAHYYKQAGKDVPFGLASCSPEQLKRHLEHAKKMRKG